MREAWKDQLQSLEKFYNIYKRLHEAMKPPYFDEEDRKLVAEKVQKFATALKQSQDVYEQREKVYEKTIRELEEVLASRQRILEEVDQDTSIFQVDLELLEFLTQRQLQLQRKLQHVMTKLDEIPNP